MRLDALFVLSRSYPWLILISGAILVMVALYITKPASKLRYALVFIGLLLITVAAALLTPPGWGI